MNSVRVDDWTAKLAITASNDQEIQMTSTLFPIFTITVKGKTAPIGNEILHWAVQTSAGT